MTEEQLDYFGQSYKYEREVRVPQTPLIGPTRVVPAVAPSLIGPVRGFMKARRTRPWLSEAAGATDEEAIAAAHGEKEEPMTEEWSRTPRP